MARFESILFWITLFGYVGVFCLNLFGFIGKKAKLMSSALRLLVLVLLCHTTLGVVRWVAAGHPPVTDTYELNVTGTWFVILIFLLFEKWGKVDRAIALVVVPVSFLVLGYGYLTGVVISPMGPAFQSPWLVVHVIFAWLSFGFYAMATGAALMLLLGPVKTGRTIAGKRLPDAEILDTSSYRFLVLGFINHMIMLVSGAIWAKKLWGHYWSWDPLETWSLIAFLYYAFYLHARSFLKWRMRRAAWLAVLGLLILAVSFWGVKWFGPSPHPGP